MRAVYLFLLYFSTISPVLSQDIFSFLGDVVKNFTASIGHSSTSRSCSNIQGKQCIFPFTYSGQQFHQCTTFNSVNGRSWCASKVDRYGQAQCNMQEDCDDCSTSCSGVQMPQPPQIRNPTCSNVHGQQCIFPFTYSEQEFHQCTTYNSVNGRPWCASKVDRDSKALCNKQQECDDCSFLTLSNPRCFNKPTSNTHANFEVEPTNLTCSNVHGHPCIFPFTYHAQEFHGCTTFNSVNKQPWCASNVDINGNAQCYNEEDCDDCSVLTLSDSRCTREPQITIDPPHSSSNCKKLRIRKNVNQLTSYEKQRLQHALRSAVANQTQWMNFPDIANFHGYPYTVCPKPGCCPHWGRMDDFLPWHRLYMVQLEEVLEPWLADTNIGLPYWDWTEDTSVPNLWEGILPPVKDFQSLPEFSWGKNDGVECNSGTDKSHSTRVKQQYMAIPSAEKLRQKINAALEEEDFSDFSEEVSSPHGDVHVGLKCTMQPQETAAYDPIFWLHHSFVDKIFADWQHNNRDYTPILNNDVPLDPFGNRTVNKYKLTNKTPAEVLDYENTLCYCYDCDYSTYAQPVHHATPSYGSPQAPPVHQSAPTYSAPAPPPPKPKYFPDMKAYVAIIVPKNIGGEKVTFQVCHKAGETEICDEDGSVALFGPYAKLNPDIAVNTENFYIKKDLLITPIYASLDGWTYWTKVHLLEGKNMMPLQTPPFLLYRVGREKIIHLQIGSQKEQYGDILDDFIVKNYCDTFVYGNGELGDSNGAWKLGHPSICG